MRTTKKTLLTAVAVLALGAAVHPSATLRSPSSSVAAGATLQLQGEEFDAGETTTLMLRGPLSEYDLRDVTADEDGTFQIALAIPGDVRPGQYRLVSLAPDGDVSASLDITVSAATTMMRDEGEENGQEGPGEMAEMGAAMARADEIPIERTRSGIGWGLIGLFVGLTAGGGAALVVRS